MQTMKGFTRDAFLPLKRMDELAELGNEAYVSATPYPHVVLDNFFNPELLDEILSEFPEPNQINWQKFDNSQEVKLASGAEASFGAATRLFLYHLNSITFLNFLSGVTGIDNLLPDPRFDGGGLHQIERGGKLGIHTDFNKHGSYQLDRRLNLLLYLNKDWKEEFGGHLELWDREMKGCQAKVLPIFNRMMIFTTTDYTYHGHPNPLNCPAGMTRKSLALYYFTNGRPADEVSGVHSTVFRAREAGEFQPTLRQRLKSVTKDFVPPIVSRSLKNFLR